MRVKQPKPKIYARSEWGARPGGGLVYSEPLSGTYYRGTAHHDADPAPPAMSYAQAAARMRQHQQTHFTLGWSDIGYHYGIAPGGQIFEGRPLNVQGSHTYMENSGNVGFFLFGALHQHPPTKEQLAAAVDLWAWLCWFLELDATKLRGHRDYMATECPGSLFYPKLTDIRKEAVARLQGDAPALQPVAAPSLELDGKRLGEVLLVDGVSYAPIRTVAEAAGLKVAWDGATKTVKLST